MEIPENTNIEIHDEPTATWWIDENGILCSVGKKDPPMLSKEEEEFQRQRFKDMFRGKKICMLLDVKYIKPPTKAERDKPGENLDHMVKAMAIILYSPLGRMVANLFLGLKPPGYPVKMFSNEGEAKEWLKQYL